MKKIVVVGGGFAGINLVKRLANDDRFQVTLVDKNNFHSFTPLLYQVGMAFIEPSSISYPFRRLFQEKDNLRFHMGCLVEMKVGENIVQTDNGILDYDYLVLAVGTESNFFGMENVKKNSWPLKTITDATNLRNHILLNMEKASRASDPAEQTRLLNIVIAGGGPTGVEVAGMLAEMALHIAPVEYPEIPRASNPIHLIEASPELLGPMSKKSQQEAEKVLRKLGVQIKLNVAVKDYVDGKVVLANGATIPSNTLIWTSGVVGKPIPGLPADVIGRGRRIMVDEFNKVKGTRNIFAIGDIALQATDKNFPNGHPQLAQVAIQQGRNLAENFKRKSQGTGLRAFAYKDKGTMAIISKYKAVVDLPNAFVKGFIAWLMWLFVHLIPINSFRNKMKLAFSWMWSFITNDPTLRLIIRPSSLNK
ncbi:MAG: NAD(P)/FAD-dependent oxidoreductase [Cyclobacteriaceae bacterium]